MRLIHHKWIAPCLVALAVAALAITRSVTPGPGRAVTDGSTHAGAPPVVLPRPTPAAAIERPALAQVMAALVDPAATAAARQHALKPAYFALVRLLRQHPERCAEIEAMLATATDPDALDVQVAVGALAGAGTPEAQASLVRLLTARAANPAFMKRLVPALGFSKNPTPELEDALRGLAARSEAGDAARLANLGMGVLAAHTAAAEPARAARIVDDYEGKLATARGDDEIRGHLAVLGNAGTADAARVVAKYLGSENPRIRSQAAEALRRVPTEQAERALLALLEDEDARVRASAAWALSYRAPTAKAVAAQAALLPGETDERVAQALVGNLWAAVERERSAVLGALAAAARAHPLDGIREQARGLLDRRG